MFQYLQSIDAENIDDVYQARFAELDRFEAGARKVHAQAIQRAKGDEKIISQADERLQRDLERFRANRLEVRENMKGTKF